MMRRFPLGKIKSLPWKKIARYTNALGEFTTIGFLIYEAMEVEVIPTKFTILKTILTATVLLQGIKF